MRDLRMSPYLQRRGLSLSFRIAVPPDLRLTIGGREITKSLKTSNRSIAAPTALSLAAETKRLFNELRARNVGKKTQSGPNGFNLTIKLDYGELGNVTSRTITAEPSESAAVIEILEAEARTRQTLHPPPITHHAPTGPPQTRQTPLAKAPTLGKVVSMFLAAYEAEKKEPMLKKYRQCLPMLLQVIGDIPVNEIKQADIKAFFALVNRLPPQWSALCRRQGISVIELSKQKHDITLAPKTFDATYRGPIETFLDSSIADWQDQGFPNNLTTKRIKYSGTQKKGENKQRPFKQEELKRLYQGDEMRQFAENPKKAHYFWLPHVGLFTGARVNEICQINPQVDIFMDSETKTWCFNITEDTEADERITKSIKAKDSRKVPIHKKLIELGFLDYFERVKSSGAKLLFPNWKPINRRASGEAEKWFREFLRSIGLRDETCGLRLSGMHAFRHTLLTYGADQDPPLSLFGITGHAQLPIDATGAGRGYLSVDMLSPLNDRAATLDQLDYGLNFFTPVAA